ncbi:hypothetical protein JAAARDRAFT_133154 [Jaapia argillacea MUCL 33604]|uniref:Uncharacterized protein n=1 Tax=Jaapia argillacea MUCL 33604 TaxID=933084 RepID=A0A067Q072_9AGAM|nr:hypothetical protein JAAARDRAFT_133154 [Jaapia argillacea MUCL 33604]
MSTKALSNGTLSLRFMQNAQRAKHLAQVEIEQAQVKDESEWEVSREVKEAWEIGSSSQLGPDVTHEPSYIPFLFPSPSDGTASSPIQSAPVSGQAPAKPKGRRSFNARGQEVVEEVRKIYVPTEPPPDSGDEKGGRGSDWSKTSKRPVTISGSMGTTFKDRKDIKKMTTTSIEQSKSSKILIHEEVNVGTDMRRPGPSSLRHAVYPSGARGDSGPPTFLKPSGVDAPANPLMQHRLKPTNSIREEGEGSEMIPKSSKREREDELGGAVVAAGDVLTSGDQTKKRKKKKKATTTMG